MRLACCVSVQSGPRVGVLVGAGCLSRCSSCAAANISAPRLWKSASSGGWGLKPFRANVCLGVSLLLLNKQKCCSDAFCSPICVAIWSPAPQVLKHCIQDNNTADKLACKMHASVLLFLLMNPLLLKGSSWIKGGFPRPGQVLGFPKAPRDNVE